jgi:putative transcriptional regulator
MSTAKQKKARERPAPHAPDWAALEALTDEEIAAQIAADPDAAPESDWSLDDPRVTVMEPFEVAAVRARLGMSQQEFASAFDLNLAALRAWEAQRRVPRSPALTLLRVINHEPAAVRRALARV